MRHLALAIALLALVLFVGCGNGQPGTVPSQSGGSTNPSLPQAKATEGCVPDAGTDNDDLAMDDDSVKWFTMSMEKAQLQESDLPTDSIPNGSSEIGSEDWNSREKLAKASEKPVETLNGLRNSGLLGAWSNNRLLNSLIIPISGEELPQFGVAVLTYLFKDSSCAQAAMVDPNFIGGEELKPGSTVASFVTQERYQREGDDQETVTSVSILIPKGIIIQVITANTPGQMPADPNWAQQHPKAADWFRQAGNPDFVPAQQLAETLAARLWDQIATIDD